MRKLLLKLVDAQSEQSLSFHFRRNRFRLLSELLRNLPKPIKILDLGGRPDIWKMEGFINRELDYLITIVNVESLEINATNVKTAVADARDLHQFHDQEFDIVFSNSVIEHVGSYEDQKRMADEIQRVGKGYFVQTPNRFFIIEPHFLFPFFQFLPIPVRMLLIRLFNLGNRSRASNFIEARERVSDINLLSKWEFISLFPEAKLFEEKLLGLCKSFVAYKTVEY